MRARRVVVLLIVAGVVVFLALALASGAAWPWIQSMWTALLAIVMANNPWVLLVLALVGLAVVLALFFRRRR
jgi:hypothetical protein